MQFKPIELDAKDGIPKNIHIVVPKNEDIGNDLAHTAELNGKQSALDKHHLDASIDTTPNNKTSM